MTFSNINSPEDFNDDDIELLAGFAQNLSIQSDEVIETITSSSVLNPVIQRALESEDASSLLADEPSQDVASDTSDFSDADADFGLLSFPEEGVAFGAESDIGDFWSRIKNVFTGLRRKVRRLFCQVVAGLENDEDLNLKQIIKDVLLIVIPVFAGTTGLMPVILPIVVSLAAMLLKHGVSRVCPV